MTSYYLSEPLTGAAAFNQGGTAARHRTRSRVKVYYSTVPISLSQAEEARRNIAWAALRTPLVLCDADGPASLYLKLENLQPIGSFKIRGAANVIAVTPRSQLDKGLLTASAGNMAQGVAFCARRLGVPATIVAPDTAPATKISAVERMGGRVIKVPFAEWWQTFETRSYPGVDATFIHAFDDSSCDGRQLDHRARTAGGPS